MKRAAIPRLHLIGPLGLIEPGDYPAIAVRAASGGCDAIHLRLRTPVQCVVIKDLDDGTSQCLRVAIVVDEGVIQELFISHPAGEGRKSGMIAIVKFDQFRD